MPIELSGLWDRMHKVDVIGRDAAGNWQAEPGATVSWVVDTTAPVITGLFDDAVRRKSKTWQWDAVDASPSTFRFLIDRNKTCADNSGAYSHIRSATNADEDGIWYIHVQARDAAGNESEVVTVSALLDTTPVLKGDINLDKGVDLADAILAAHLMLGLRMSAPIHWEVRISADGEVGMVDVVYILQKTAQLR